MIAKSYIENGLITERHHPNDETLKIYNYTPKVQFKRLWDDTTKLARGLIVKDNRIVAMPFRKFFNLNEIEETKEENLPSEVPEITQKIDGALFQSLIGKLKTNLLT